MGRGRCGGPRPAHAKVLLLLLLVQQQCSANPRQCGDSEDDDASYRPDPGPDGGCPKGYAYVCPASRAKCSGPDGGCCDQCIAGQYQPSKDVRPGTACKACPGGKYTSVVRSSACKTCSSGQFSAASASLCTTCAAGTFAPAAESASCDPCPSGKFVATPSATACAAWTCCPAGYYMTGATHL